MEAGLWEGQELGAQKARCPLKPQASTQCLCWPLLCAVLGLGEVTDLTSPDGIGETQGSKKSYHGIEGYLQGPVMEDQGVVQSM
jgi:hypothetical protein